MVESIENYEMPIMDIRIAERHAQLKPMEPILFDGSLDVNVLPLREGFMLYSMLASKDHFKGIQVVTSVSDAKGFQGRIGDLAGRFHNKIHRKYFVDR